MRWRGPHTWEPREPQRSRHLSPVRRAEAQGRRLGGRAAPRQLAAHLHRRAHHRRRPARHAPPRQARRLHPPLHPRHRHRRGRGQARVQDPRRGLQQAKDYAEILGLKFAYATNGHGIVEFDYTTGLETELDRLPHARSTCGSASRATSSSRTRPPTRSRRPATASQAATRATTRRSRSTAPSRRSSRGRSASCSPWPPAPARPTSPSRSAGGSGRRAGTPHGKEGRKPRILYLADRNILIDDPKDKQLRALRRRPLQDRGRRGRQEPRDVLRHLPGDRPGRGPARALQASTRPTSSTSSSSTSATAAAPRTRATGARSSSTSRPPTSSA